VRHGERTKGLTAQIRRAAAGTAPPQPIQKVGRTVENELKLQLPTLIWLILLAHTVYNLLFISHFYVILGNFPPPMGCLGDPVWLILGACS
jgi:hypothetical protein